MQNNHFSRVLFTFAALVPLVAMGACDSHRATAIVATGVQVDIGGANPADPFGACVVKASTASSSPLTCSQGTGKSCAGGAETSSCSPTTGCNPQVAHVFCEHTCYVAEDCPVPATGNSQPYCQPDFHACQLPCGDGVQCPTGFTCQSTEPFSPRDAAGNSPYLPMLCMQTITFISDPDAGVYTLVP